MLAMHGFVTALLLLGSGLGLLGVVYLVAWSVRRAPAESVEAFLSGNRSVEHAFSRFHVRWYALTMLYLAFEMEMLFMYPWALVVADEGASAVIEMFVFLAILLAGVVYAWREGVLRWV
ncbi:NADH-quinone oxidoreductase subunit A [Actinopolyspora alba]|nr:NADH-quinone oxidoreductase subunit A [Actinopolyspora mzabensis]SFE42551.1 NADH-quinone oxidoreductase subunit A [Actinopolyspora alba]